MDRSFESVLSSFAPPVVGILAQHVYGYKPLPKGHVMGIERDRENAESLGKALYTAIGIPMAICTLVYSFLYCTYPRDRDRARMDALVVSENHDFGHKSVIDGREESVDFVDNDKQRLLKLQI